MLLPSTDVRVTVVGHAGLYLETRFGTVLCDPWFVPAFHGSWFVFPRNDRLDLDRFTEPDYLYISHLHGDHFDVPFLRDHVSRSAQILLPDFPTPELEHGLRELGFDRFVRCPNGEVVDLDGLEVTILAETAPSDGPIGDSALLVCDGTGRVLDQNDCRPTHPERIADGGTIDLHFLQFSGAMWWPVVYDLPADVKHAAGVAKRDGQMRRSQQYAEAVGARAIVPSAGPPCFVDPDLYDLNDLDGRADNIFPDATVYLERLHAAGLDGRIGIPGTVFELDGDAPIVVTHPIPDDEVAAIFTDKREHLRSYQADWLPWLADLKASWPDPKPDLVGRLAAWWEPLLATAPNTRLAIGRKLLIRAGDEDVLVDFLEGEVRSWDGDESYQYRLVFPRGLVELCVERQSVDWSNDLMLSLRFEAWRPGEFCEEIFSFLKSLNPERMAVLESYVTAKRQAVARPDDQDDEIVLGDFVVQRRCPHRKADLSRFGEVDGCTLTCTIHGWEWDLETGECLTSPDHPVAARPVEVPVDLADPKP